MDNYLPKKCYNTKRCHEGPSLKFLNNIKKNYLYYYTKIRSNLASCRITLKKKLNWKKESRYLLFTIPYNLKRVIMGESYKDLVSY